MEGKSHFLPNIKNRQIPNLMSFPTKQAASIVTFIDVPACISLTAKYFEKIVIIIIITIIIFVY